MASFRKKDYEKRNIDAEKISTERIIELLLELSDGRFACEYPISLRKHSLKNIHRNLPHMDDQTWIEKLQSESLKVQ